MDTQSQTKLKFASYRPEALNSMVDILNATSIALFGVPDTNAEDLLNEFSLPGFDLERDIVLAHDDSENLVGFGMMWNLNRPAVRRTLDWFVDPTFLDSDIDAALLDRLEQRANEDLDQIDAELRVCVQSHPPAKDLRQGQVLQTRGYEHVRSTYTMLRVMDTAPELPRVPAGLLIRPMNGSAEDVLLAAQAIFEAFNDHYGKIPEEFDVFFKRVQHRLLHTPGLEPSACFLAFDGDQVAGVAINNVQQIDHPERGWVENLGVCRAYRKHGLGLALLLTSFNEFYTRGLREAGLGVDAGNLTGALRLYQRAGMVVEHEWHTYEKEIRPGRDIIKRALD